MESSKEYSNFITPPDFVEELKHTVLMIDVSAEDLQALATFCKNSAVYFNIYLYNYEMQDTEWFRKARDRSDVIVLNNSTNPWSVTKEVLIELPKTWYYGSDAVAKNLNHINHPLEYFIKYVENR